MEPVPNSPPSEPITREQGGGIERADPRSPAVPGPSPHPWDGYLTGPENELAVAVAVSARSAPGTWPRREWPAGLVNRLLGGLTARVDPPGLAARRRYVLHGAGQHGLTLPAEAIERLAWAADGYRTLDGWLSRL